jgi:hypothetical protein
LGDFDKDGMEIYRKVKKRIKNIELIIPENYGDIAKSISETDHKSSWVGFDSNAFSDVKTKGIIQYLINTDKWIEEESIRINITSLLNKF